MSLLLFAEQSLQPVYRAEGLTRLIDSPMAIATVTAAAFALVGATLWCTLQERSALKPYQWRLILLLRSLALIAAVLSLAGWQKRPVTESTAPSVMAILADSSTSMQLPSEVGSEVSRQVLAAKTAEQLADALGVDHEIAFARFAATLNYEDPAGIGEQEQTGTHGATTRMGDAIRRVLEDHPAATLAGLVVLSDGRSNGGVDPIVAAQEATERGVPIHTIGYGPISEPPRLEIARVEAPKRVFSKDPIRASVALSSHGGFQEEADVTVRLLEEDGSPVTALQAVGEHVLVRDEMTDVQIEIESPPPGNYLLEASTTAADSVIQIPLESVDRKTTVLLLAGGPTREYRFLRDQLHRDRSFEVDVLLQTSLSGVSQDSRTLLSAAPEDVNAWNEYDVVVAFDPDWEEIGPASLAAMREWVSRRGGGVLLVQGAVRTAALKAPLPESISLLAPVSFSSDPLDALSSQQNREPRPISITTAGLSADYLRLGGAATQRAFWTDFDGFYSTPKKVEPKMGAMVHARFGSKAGSDAADPLFVEHFFGAGRVAYLATGEVWRLRRIDAKYFTELYTKLLRRLSQGRLLGAEALGSLVFDQSRYDSGAPMRLRLNLVDTAMATPETIEAILLTPKGKSTQVKLASLGQSTAAYVGEATAGGPGRYEASVQLAAPDETPILLTAQTEVSLPMLESRATTRDVETLRTISEASGGVAILDRSSKETMRLLTEATPSRAETSINIGPPDADFGRRMARLSLLMVVGLLTTEWVLRRLWRLA